MNLKARYILLAISITIMATIIILLAVIQEKPFHDTAINEKYSNSKHENLETFRVIDRLD